LGGLLERRIAAIVAADMVGFSHLIELDEAGTLIRQKQHRLELIDPTIRRYNGRIIKLTGDGFLAEFSSVVEATQCAVLIQRDMAPLEAEVPEDRRILYRIAVHLGDIVFDDGDIFGDGVNIAARLEGLAEPGGIVVSGAAYDMLKSQVEVGYRALGEQKLKNIARPVRVYQVTDGDAAPPLRVSHRGVVSASLILFIALVSLGWVWMRPDLPPIDQAMLSLELPAIAPEKTLAVLPFVNLSGNSELLYFSDGLSEDLTTDLSKLPGLTVIAHRSSFDFRDAESGFKQIAENLGVRFLVRGTVRNHAEYVRVNVSLVDPFDGFSLWSERFDSKQENMFDVQDEVVRQIVQQLSLTLNTEGKPEQAIEPDAYFMLLRGLDALRQVNAEGNLEAREYFERALQFDPQYARAYASIALTYARETELSEPGEVTAQSIGKGLEAAITAIQLDPKNPHAYFALGVLNLAIREYDHALAAARHTFALDGNYSDGYALFAEASVYGGSLEEALIAIERAKLLHPRHPSTYHWIEGHILFQLGRFDEARPFLEEAVEGDPKFLQGLILLAANYGQQGEMDLAAKTMTQAKAIKSDFDVDRGLEDTPYRFKDRHERVVEGLRRASLPQ
jgi:adenylate cyclase